MYNLTGEWKTVKNKALNIGDALGNFNIIQNGSEIFVHGYRSGAKRGYECFGYGIVKDDSDEIIISWTDTSASPSDEKKNGHACKIKIDPSGNKTETIEILYGGDFNFGTWERI